MERIPCKTVNKNIIISLENTPSDKYLHQLLFRFRQILCKCRSLKRELVVSSVHN